MRVDESGKRHLSWEPVWAFGASLAAFLLVIQFQPVDSLFADGVTRGNRWGYLWPLLLVGTIFVAYGFHLRWRGKQEYDDFPFRRFLALSAPLILIYFAGLFGITSLPDARDWGYNAVGNYCAWGSLSKAQFQGCVDHVSLKELRSMDTRASRFAFDSEASCGSAPGIYCWKVDRVRDSLF